MGPRLEKFDKEPSTERTLYLIGVEEADDLVNDSVIPESPFVCLLAWDAGQVPDDVVLRVAKFLVDAGTRYVCAWGSDCKRVHDLVDQARFDPEADYEVNPVIFTTWHDDEPLEEAIYCFLECDPDWNYDDDCTAAVAISVGNLQYAESIRCALEDPRAFKERILEEPEE